MNNKLLEEKREQIREIIDEFGVFTTHDVQADSSPCIFHDGHVSHLGETFSKDSVTIHVYDEISGQELYSYDAKYTDIKENEINEIHSLALQWKEQEQSKEEKPMKITTEFWDFIEKYLPGYHERDDVLRHSSLQLFIDGHDTTVLGEVMTVQQAELELSELSLKLTCEAIDAYTKAQGVECKECKNHNQFPYCPICGKKQVAVEQTQNPWRCNQCGSTDLQSKAWVNTNTNEYVEDAIFDEEDQYCKSCEEHTQQVQQSELLKEINQWWEDEDGETKEAVTNLNYDNYSSYPDPDEAFDNDCNAFWNNLGIERKVTIWKHYTCDK